MELAKVRLKGRNGSKELKDLFVYTSLRCNLSCSHCFVGSSPKNDTLDDITLSDARPLLDEAEKFGVRNIYFTGGEPFASKYATSLIRESLKIAPVTVYTNATKPLELALNELSEAMEEGKHPLMLRVSLDHYDPTIHDVFYNRGLGSFKYAVVNSIKAAKLGIPIAITAQEDIHNHGSEEYVETQFRDLFKREGVELTDVKVLPNIPQGAQLNRTAMRETSPITSTEAIPDDLMCGTSRTILKYDGKVHVFPCTILIPSTKEEMEEFMKYQMGSTLKESFPKEQVLDHPSCRAYCVSGGATCANK